ncbi:hypothetical protein PHYSODRAFT_381607, partial [Phytophthora sojae]
FKELWRILRRSGWTSKPPPLGACQKATEYRYIRPGCSMKDQEGEDFFVGEEALV